MAKKTAKKKARKRNRATAASRVPGKPKKWDSAVSVAYLRMIHFPNISQKRAAGQVGVSERTVRAWEAAPWWVDAKAEARERFFCQGDAAAMRGLNAAFEDDEESARTSRWWAERRMPELAPPKLGIGIGNDDDKPVHLEIVLVKHDAKS